MCVLFTVLLLACDGRWSGLQGVSTFSLVWDWGCVCLCVCVLVLDEVWCVFCVDLGVCVGCGAYYAWLWWCAYKVVLWLCCCACGRVCALFTVLLVACDGRWTGLQWVSVLSLFVAWDMCVCV